MKPSEYIEKENKKRKENYMLDELYEELDKRFIDRKEYEKLQRFETKRIKDYYKKVEDAKERIKKKKIKGVDATCKKLVLEEFEKELKL